MPKKAKVIIETEEELDTDVDDDTAEEFVQKLWEARFNSVGYEHDYEVTVESIEED